jgi:isoquinoline 1-oxidoreductase beta subunit
MSPARPTRREFLQSTGTLAGLVVALRMSDPGAGAPMDGFDPSAFLQITPDDQVTLWAAKLEMGQGVRTLLPMMIAEELEIDWTRVRINQPSTGGRFAGLDFHTSGSGSSSSMYRALRTAGAAAREMLVAAAATAWGVSPDSCHAERGVVTHAGTSQRATYGQLATAAARLPVPKTPTLKDPSAFHLLGTRVKRVDGPAIVTGRARYGLDVRVPGMLVASLERAPRLGATLVGFDASAARQVPGVKFVVEVTRGIQPAVAVVATDTWAALRGREALKVEWAPGRQSTFDSNRFLDELPQAFTRATYKVRREGDADAALAQAAQRVEASYLFPFQAHAPLETMNCTADVGAHRAEFWVPTQADDRSLEQASKITGLSPTAITVHCELMGGGFGRRLYVDYVAEAADLSKTIGQPVQVFWTRQDDMRHGYFQPATAEQFTAGLDHAGALVALVHRTTGSQLTIEAIHAGRNIWTTPVDPLPPDGFERDQSPWGAYDNPYEIPNLRVDCADVTSPVPVGPWRAVEYPSTVFGRESFLDEIAHRVGKDPITLRLDLLPRRVKQVGPYAIDQARLARVLEALRTRVEGLIALRPLTADGRLRGYGVAANVYHGRSYLAMAAEVSLARDGSDVRVERITTVIDCGRALNPLGLEGQTESGITWGLSATLLGKMDFADGAGVQSTYADFRVLRMDQMPELETVILDSGAPPSGYGEHPVPLVAPAVANAVFAASGKRVRRLPITPEAIRNA